MSAPLVASRGGAAAMTTLLEPHHDGSELYVPEPSVEPGAEAAVRLRVPRGVAVDDVVLRYVRDGEARAVRAEVDAETEAAAWWRAAIPVGEASTRYRWLLGGGDLDYAWVNGTGVVRHDVPDADDFVLAPDARGPAWHLPSVVYEIFPDRFARGGVEAETPPWAAQRAWDLRPTGRGVRSQFDLYGGDLRGIEQRLDHVVSLGANVIYLTPVFPAGSTHRYDATTFDHVDRLLGGDEAFRALADAAHDRGIRLVGDLTLNHTGSSHEWFVAAQDAPSAPERDFYFFDGSPPLGYACWLDVPSLPKLNWDSRLLRERMLGVVRQWLATGFDGWRIDVANMAGRYRGRDLGQELARSVRAAATAADGDALLIAEHAHDFRADLAGDGWHGTMNYGGFLRPVWSWLRRDELSEELRNGFWGMPIGLHRVAGTMAVATMRAFRAGVPWQSTLHSWTLLDSHDTARFRSVVGSRDRHLVGLGLQMTTPGVPMVFAGDEIGLEGEWGEDARRTMPWERPATWDRALLTEYRRLIALRRSSDALARGGIRYVHVDDEVIAYLREAPGERLLCLASRGAHEPLRLPLTGLPARSLEPVYGEEARHADGWVELPAEGPALHIWRLESEEERGGG